MHFIHLFSILLPVCFNKFSVFSVFSDTQCIPTAITLLMLNSARVDLTASIGRYHCGGLVDHDV